MIVANDIQDALRKCIDGRAISPEIAKKMMHATDADLSALLETASMVRDQHWGHVVTYSRKVFIPLTNLCRDTCGYCTFVRQPRDPLAHTMTPEEVLRVANAGKAAGCKEALFSLGDKPELKYAAYREWLASQGYASTIAYVRAMCDLVLRETGLLPHVNPGAMSSEDIALLRPASVSMGMMLEGTSKALTDKGGAHRGSPDKYPAVRLRTMAAAGEQHVPFTTGILIGIGETSEERVDALFAIKRLHEQYGHIQEVIIQNFRAKTDIRMRNWPEPEPIEMVRTIAIARLIFGHSISVQAPPNLIGTPYREYLRAGLNDWGGISPVTKDHINPERSWPALEHLRIEMQQQGFTLRERLGIYPDYIQQRAIYLDEGLHRRVMEHVDTTGLVRLENEEWSSR